MDFCLLLEIQVYNVGKKISKNVSSKYSKKFLDHPKQSATDVFKTVSKIAIQKTEEATDNLFGNKIGDRITTVSKISSRNNLETNEEEILRDRFTPSEQGHKFFHDLRLKEENY